MPGNRPPDAPPPGHEDRASDKGLGKPDIQEHTPSPDPDGLTDEQLVELFGIIRPEPGPEMLAKPTIGAWRRANGVEAWSDFARVAFAVELVQEAQRRVLFHQLDGLLAFVAAGASPDQIVRRMQRVVDDYHGRPPLEAAA